MTKPLSKNVWISCPKPNPMADVRLFCFAYAGGAATVFRDWGQRLSEFEVCAINYPGRGMRMMEDSIGNMSVLVEEIAEGILPALDKPFAFFGHSMGASLAFEVTRYLRKKHGLLPVHLFVSGRGAPQLPRDARPMHDRSDKDFIAGLKELNGTPQEVFENADLLALVLPILRADFKVVETYAFQEEEPLRLPMTAFGGTKDDRTANERLIEWGVHTSLKFTHQIFEGDHFFLNEDPAKTQLLKAVKEELQKTMQNVVR